MFFGRDKMRTIKNICFVLKFVWKRSKASILVLFVPAISSLLISVTNVLGFKNIIQAVERKSSMHEVVFFIAIFLLLNTLSDFLYSIYHNRLLPKYNIILGREINVLLMKKASRLDIKCFDDSDFYNQYTRALGEANSRIIAVLNSVSNLFGAIFSISALIGMIFMIQPLMAIFSVCGVLVGFFITLTRNKVDYNKSVVLTPFGRRRGYVNRVFYQKEFAEEIRQTPSILKLLIEEYEINSSREYEIVKKFSTQITLLDIVKNLGSTIPVVMSMLYIAPNVLAGSISVGDFTASFNAVTNLTMQLSSMLHSISSFNLHGLFIDNLRKVLDYKSEIEECNSNINADISQGIVIRNVSFQYPNNQEYSLKNIDLSINKGEKIALVGYNGAGKSTLIKLLLRMYDPSVGKVVCGKYDLKEIDVRQWREKFGLVFQKYQVFAVSIAENVLLRKVENHDDRVRVCAALERVGLLDDVLKLHNGIDTMVTKEFDNEGIVFSGGQLQKLALARIYASDKPVVILDEPSASLDPYAEYKLNMEIQKMDKNKTVIVVSHRLSCTSMMDKIIFMENGNVAECGTHAQLMKNNKSYAEIYRVQKKSYDDGIENG